MQKAYQKLLEFKVTHEYYSNGVCKDFEIFPTQTCQVLLNNFSMRFRSTEDGFDLYYEGTMDGATFTPKHAMSALPADSKFQFGMRLKNALLVNFTNLGSVSLNQGIFRFSNDTTSLDTADQYDVLAMEHLSSRPEVFSLEFNPSTTALTRTALELGKYSGTAIQTLESVSLSRGANNVPFRYPVNVGAYGPGKYQLAASGPAGTEFSRTYHLDQELGGDAVFGVIELKKNADFNAFAAASPPYVPIRYKATFASRRAVKWRFVLVRKFAITGAITMLEPAGGMSPPANNRYNAIPFTFSSVTLPTGQGYEDLGYPVLLFDATTTAGDSLIPYYEESKVNIVVQKGGVDYVKPVPGPSINHSEPEIFLFI